MAYFGKIGDSITFVVGTGRCGSTMLSRLLHRHPDILSVSEFFSTIKAATRNRRLPGADIDGTELWAMLSAPIPTADAMIHSGLIPSEFSYPYGSGRFDVQTGVPAICHCLLPILSEDPDKLFDELSGVVPDWPRRTATVQYRAFFGHLAQRLGRRVIVERSAPSLPLIPRLLELFPDANFVHMHRDGPDCAVSMSRHPMFRRDVLIGEAVNAVGGEVTSWEALLDAMPEVFYGLIAPPFDAERLMAYPLSPVAFATRQWSEMVIAGLSALTNLPLDRWISLKYENLVSDPASELTRLAEFLGVPAESGWLATAASIVEPHRAGAASRLGAADYAALRAACEAGTQAIAKVERWRSSMSGSRPGERSQ